MASQKKYSTATGTVLVLLMEHKRFRLPVPFYVISKD